MTVVYFLLGGLADGFLTAYRGWIISMLWSWFIVPQFSVGPLSIFTALGISLLVTLLTHEFDATKAKQEPVEAILAAFFGLTSLLAIGYIVHSFA